PKRAVAGQPGPPVGQPHDGVHVPHPRVREPVDARGAGPRARGDRTPGRAAGDRGGGAHAARPLGLRGAPRATGRGGDADEWGDTPKVSAGVDKLEARILSVEDAEFWARRRLPRALAQAIEVGEPARAFGRNLAAFAELELQPRAAVFHPHRDLRTTVLGHEISMPVIIAPAGNARILHVDGEPGIARAAGAAGTNQCVRTFPGYPNRE